MEDNVENSKIKAYQSAQIHGLFIFIETSAHPQLIHS
jgi:hypothetical protein